MYLSVADVASLFGVPERDVYQWIHDDGLPVERVDGTFRVDRVELLEWATLRRRQVSPALFRLSAVDQQDDPARLDRALAAGTVLRDLKATSKEQLLAQMVAEVPLSEAISRPTLVELLLAREALGTTAVGDGIAIPHPRFPLLLPQVQPSVSVAFLDEPIDYGAADAQRVHTLFLLVTPTMSLHLELLSRLASALTDPMFRAVVAMQPTGRELIDAAHDLMLRQAATSLVEAEKHG